MTTEIDLVGEKKTFLTNTSFLKKIKFQQIKLDALGQKCCQKLEKRQYKCVRTHEVWQTTSFPVRSCTHFEWPPIPNQLPVAYVLVIDGPFLNKNNI